VFNDFGIMAIVDDLDKIIFGVMVGALEENTHTHAPFWYPLICIPYIQDILLFRKPGIL
jgi:hypothetical protein